MPFPGPSCDGLTVVDDQTPNRRGYRACRVLFRLRRTSVIIILGEDAKRIPFRDVESDRGTIEWQDTLQGRVETHATIHP